MRAQISVEFFLVVSFMIVLTIILYNQNASQFAAVKSLDDAFLTRIALDKAGNAVDAVWLGGNASKRSEAIFIPKSANCLYYDGSRLYCVMPSSFAEPPDNVLSRQVRAPQLYFECVPPFNAGWSFLSVENNSTHVVVSC